jgi:hypothetical protein
MQDLIHTRRSMSVESDFSSNTTPDTILRVTKERWAQIGITTEFLIVVRTLGEFFRLKHVLGTNFSTAAGALYVGGALIAACSCTSSDAIRCPPRSR